MTSAPSRASPERRYPSIDLFDRLLELRAAALVRRGLELTFELGACEAQRFARPHLLGVARVLGASRDELLARELLHPFLYTGVLINKSFAGITHNCTL